MNPAGQLVGGEGREHAADPSLLAVVDAPGNERSTTDALSSESDPVRQVADSWVAKWPSDAVVATQTVAIVLAIATDSVDIARRSLAAVAEYLQWRGSQNLPLDRESLWVEAELEAFREECHPSARASELIERARRADLGVPGRRTVQFQSIRTVELEESDRAQFVRALGRLVHTMHSKHVDDGNPAEAA